jgi:MurNAc alpha-1-phosphate uridylyltransferase
MQAMILAAGRGERMGNLVKDCPKVLLKVNGKSLLVYHLENLQRAGVTDVVINVHYLAEKITHTLGDGSDYGVKIHYSPETELLGMGGGVHNALPLLGEEPFFVISGDMWTDYDFRNLPQKITGLAHLVMVDNPPFHAKGDYSLNDGFIIEPEQQTYNYGGFGVFRPEFFTPGGAGSYGITKLLAPAIQKRVVTGEHFQGNWMNLNTQDELNKLNQRFQS